MNTQEFESKCFSSSIKQLQSLKEYQLIPSEVNVNKLTKKELCKLLTIIYQANKDGSSEQFFSLLNMVGGKNPESVKLKEVCDTNVIPKQFIRIVKPTKRLYHGRSVTKAAGIWESEKDFRKIMWWAVDKITPLLYASTSIKGRSLDPFYRWDVYEARVKEPLPFLLITKKSIEYILNTPELANIKCEGKTIGKWIKKAFPIRKGKLKRRSHIDSDRKMSQCLCGHLNCVGYIADEIDVIDGPGKLHKEVLVCSPEETLKLKQYTTFSTKKGQQSVERYLNEETQKLLPDEVKNY